MPSPSLTSPIFLQSAEDISERLHRVSVPAAQELAREADELVAEFRGWLNARPAGDRKVQKIQELFSLTRRAMELLSVHDPISGRRLIARDEEEGD